MSKMQHADAWLSGYGMPIFPITVHDLNELCSWPRGGFNGEVLGEFGKTIPGFFSRKRSRTSDDYSWFWGLYFRLDSGCIAVLFPWAQDWDKKDNTQADRSIAVHVSGNINPIHILEFCNLFTSKFRRFVCRAGGN